MTLDPGKREYTNYSIMHIFYNYVLMVVFTLKAFAYACASAHASFLGKMSELERSDCEADLPGKVGFTILNRYRASRSVA